MRRLLCTLVLLAGCNSHVHFADRKVLWHEGDNAPVPMPPVRPDLEVNWEGMRDIVFRNSERVLSIDVGYEAVNVNALDDVADSTWFEDRRRDPASPDDQPRYRPLSAEVVATGGVPAEDTPIPPYTIVDGKTVGSARGFTVRDARGTKYLFKLDPPGLPYLVTSTEVVATRLAWAAGWNVPAEQLIELAVDDLRLAPDAVTRDQWGKKVAFTADSLRGLLRGVTNDGGLRVLASRWIPGHIIGWFSYQGRDVHDANDRVDHQDRRDLRGFGVWSAWVDNVDTLDNNTLDSYVGASGRGHVVHYQQDVGGALGTWAAQPIESWMGTESYFSPSKILGSIATLGFYPRAWDGGHREARARLLTRWPQLGFFDVEHFQPRAWQPVVPNPAFDRQTRRDRYWGAKQVTRFSRDEVLGAIAAGQYPPDVAEHLMDVLWGRREKVARAYFADVAALDGFRLEGDQLCFDDLWIAAGLGGEGATLYQARERDSGPIKLAPGQARCVVVPMRPGYRVISLRAQRPGERHFGPTVNVHLVDRSTRRNIVGIER